MAFLLSLSKLKSLAPLGVVGASVLITIKLLTTQTPINKEELKVNAEEDISLVNYEDEIVIPPPPEEEKPVQEEEQEEKVEEREESDGDDTEETEDESDSEQEEEEQKKDQEKEKPKSRKFIQGNPFSEMLSKLLSGNKKK